MGRCSVAAFLVLPALLSAGLTAAPARAAIVAGVAPSTPAGSDTAVNPPSGLFSFFVEHATPPPAYEIAASTIPSSWKNALDLDIHNGGLDTGDTGSARSFVRVGAIPDALGTSSWVGWRERVLTDGWVFTGGGVYVPGTSPTLVPGATASVSADGTTINFGFDPLSLGAEVFIVKQMQYTGATIAPGRQLRTTIDVIANPLIVPEPAAATLLGLATLALASRRRGGRR